MWYLRRQRYYCLRRASDFCKFMLASRSQRKSTRDNNHTHRLRTDGTLPTDLHANTSKASTIIGWRDSRLCASNVLHAMRHQDNLITT
eukprot:1280665-Amphidinium_carterae.1